MMLVQVATVADGSFTVNVPSGILLRCRVSSMESDTFYTPQFRLSGDSSIQVSLAPHTGRQLSEVTVRADAPALVRASGNKIVYQVAGSINAQGSNGLDAVKRTPGVIVERDNAIGINGRKGVLILLNGKPSYLQGEELVNFLKSLPASGIKSIEVMSNGTAQYDAAGSGGILNIRLNKSLGNGFNMTLGNGLAYGYTLKQNTEATFNVRRDKLNIFGNYNHVLGHYGYRYGMTRWQNDQEFYSPTTDTDRRKTFGGMLGADYALSERHTLGIALNGNFISGPGVTDTRTTIRETATQSLLHTLIAQNDYYRQNADRYNANLNYRYQDTAGNAFNFDADYGYFDGGSGNLQPNSYYSPSGQLESAHTYRSLNSRAIHLYALASGYQTSLGKGKIDAGLKYSAVSAANSFMTSSLEAQTEVTDLSRSNNFDYTERIAAAYLQYQVPLTKKLKMDAGIRLEHTHTAGSLVPLPGAALLPQLIGRNYLNVFPALNLGYQLSADHALSAGYGKRIDRPSYQSLNPFEYLLDELSFVRGNPFLQPQITHKFEMQYAWPKTIVNVSYSVTNNYAAQITDTLDVNKVVMTPKNLGRQYYTGLTVIRQLEVMKGWNISLSATGYHQRNKVSFGEYRDFNLSHFAGTGNLQQTFKLPFRLQAELSASYYSKRLGGSNETMKQSSQIDLGFHRSLFTDKATVKLAFTDIFLGNNWDSVSRMNGLHLDSYGHGETRQVKLNFSCNLGRSGLKGPSKRNSSIQAETQRL